jgi:hypothetical protein
MRIHRKILKLFRKNKYSYYPRDYYYAKLLDKYSSIESYISLANINDKQALFTDKNISFSDNPDFKKNQKKYIQKKYGKPNYTIVNNFPFGKITILFYRLLLGNHKVKLELHFFQKSLIMYNYEFSYLKNESKINILNVLKEKYKINKDIVPSHCYIVNRENTMIVFLDNVNFTIYYIDYINSDIYSQMNSLIKEVKQLKKREMEKEKQEFFRRL